MGSLSRRVFDHADQERFATSSGDRNPMHMDPLLARRTQAGAPVVHGIHLLLWALDSLAAAQPELSQPRSIRAIFNKFVYVGETVDLVVAQQDSSRARMNLMVGTVPCVRITADLDGGAGDGSNDSMLSLEPVALHPQPIALDFEAMASRSGRFECMMTTDRAAALFPCAARWLGAKRIAALAASSYLVGMVCPGLYSIYSELAIRTCTEEGAGSSLGFRVITTDRRFHSVEMEVVGGGITGIVKSFVRNPPVEQASANSLMQVVRPGEFAGSTALVIGGSRGLGELTAKLIACGGGRAILTWSVGKADAERVAAEIRSAGGRCETLSYDARKPADEQLTELAEAPTHAYYFATPAIFRRGTSVFDRERLNDFLEIYVDGFWNLIKALRLREPRISLFYPSSVALAERPEGMTEYTMAKAAGEVLCVDINKILAPAHVTVRRLPRLPTDQTATVTPMDAADPIATMLPVIREVQSWPK